jgi:cytochrome c-type biogenesis protein CcmH/NrfG
MLRAGEKSGKLGEVCAKMGRTTEAEEAYREAYRLQPAAGFRKASC